MKKIMCLLGALVAAAAAGCGVQPPVVTKEFPYTIDNARFIGYLACDADVPGKRPGILTGLMCGFFNWRGFIAPWK